MFRKPSRLGASAPFIGRVEELRRLNTALNLAAEGHGSTVFLTGQPGIGKTRLARESLARARERGFRVMEGRAFPLRVGLAYAPLLDAIGPLLRRLDPDFLETLVNGLPDLGHLFGELRLISPVSIEGLGDPALEKTRLFESVLRFLDRLTSDAPIVLFVDDVHWADPATLELLHYLAYGLADRPALLLATYGPDTSGSMRELRSLVGSLRRDKLVDEMLLASLAPEFVDKFVRGILRGHVPDSLLEFLNARAGGTPLFVEAYIAALIDSGNLFAVASPKEGWIFSAEGTESLPPSVRRLTLERLEGLEPDERYLLEVIAIMGDAAPHVILGAASGLAEDSLLEVLRRLQAMGLVHERIEGAEVAYSMPHPLIQDAVYSEMPEMARRRVHMAAIKAIESFTKDRPDYAGRLAGHYRGAGNDASSERAVEVLVAAGNRAFAVYANEAAAGHYSAALALVREGGVLGAEGGESPSSTPNPPPPTIAWLLERLGEALERTGAGEAAIAAWSEALAEHELLGSSWGARLAVSRLCCQLATAESNRGQFESAKSHLAAGLSALQRGAGHEPCQELADLLYALFFVFDRLGDVSGMAESARELLSVASLLQSPRAEADAKLVAVIVSLGQGDVSVAREHALAALEIADSFSENRELLTSCYARGLLVIIGMRLGEHRFTRIHAEKGLAVARHLGAPSLEVIFRCRLAYVEMVTGDLKESLRHSTEAVSLARRMRHPRDLAFALASRAMTLTLLGDLSEAAGCIAEVRTVCGGAGTADRYVIGMADVAETTLALEMGRVERALAIAMDFFPNLEPSFPAERPLAKGTGLIPPHIPVGLTLLAEAQALAGQPERALVVAGKLRDLGPSGNLYLEALATRTEGLARRVLGETEVAIACFVDAAEKFAGIDMPFEAARARLELATVAQFGAVSQREQAALFAQQSLGTFERLGARRYAELARQLLRGLGITIVAIRHPRLAGVAVSERELEIARLVTEGMTTPEIARRLILSPRTVSRHLERLYARLGIGTRTALARCVIEAGLIQLKK